MSEYDDYMDTGSDDPPRSPECRASEHSRCRPPYLANDYPCECPCHSDDYPEEQEP